MSEVIDLLSKRTHFFNLRVTPASGSRVNTCSKGAMRIVAFFEKNTMSSRYTSANCHFFDHSMTFIARWNVADAFFRPNDISANWKTMVARDCLFCSFAFVNLNLLVPSAGIER